jgi:hypothetical protein
MQGARYPSSRNDISGIEQSGRKMRFFPENTCPHAVINRPDDTLEKI